MTALITWIDADEIGNTVLRDLAMACCSREDFGIDPLYIGTLRIAARVEHDQADAEIVVVSYPDAGTQLWIASDGGSPDSIDLGVGETANTDTALTTAVQRAVDTWIEDWEGLGNAVLDSPADPYRK